MERSVDGMKLYAEKYAELFLRCEKLEKFTWTRISVLYFGYVNHYTTQISYYVIIFTCNPSVSQNSERFGGKFLPWTIRQIIKSISHISVYDQDNLVQLLGLFNMI